MRPGPKSKSTEAKIVAGTYRPSRDGDRVSYATSTPSPVMPDYLSAAAKAIWREEIPRLVHGGAGEPDSSLFARYCAAEAISRSMLKKGELPVAALLSELRKMGELLGLAGAGSRKSTPSASTVLTNGFAAFKN